MEATAEVSKTFNEKIRKYCDMTLLSCAYAGTGNVLKVFVDVILFTLWQSKYYARAHCSTSLNFLSFRFKTS